MKDVSFVTLFLISIIKQVLQSFHFFGRDHMQWSKEEEAAARKRVEENSAVRVLLEEQGRQLHVVASGAWFFSLTFR